MSEVNQTITEVLEAKRMVRAAKRMRRVKASRCFREAASLARDSGLHLVRHSESHYALRRKGKFEWLLNIYPGNLRLMPDKKKRTPPELDLPDIWGLLDVVKSATRIRVPRDTRKPFTRHEAAQAPERPTYRREIVSSTGQEPQVGDFDTLTFCRTHGEVVRQLTEEDLKTWSELDTPEFADFAATMAELPY